MAAGTGLSTAAIATLSTVFFGLVFVGLGLAAVLSLIPTYTNTKDITSSGEKYCISNYKLSVLFTNTSTNFTSAYISLNDSYLLSTACYRILQSYNSDSLLSTCLLSNCYSTNLTSTVAATSLSANITLSCSVVVYYVPRCTDQSATSGLNNNQYSTGNSACRKQRFTNIDGALGATPEFTNVPSLTFNGSNTVPVSYISALSFTNTTQDGSYYCGTISQSEIETAVYSQASG